MPTPLKNKKKEKKWDSLKPPTAEPLPAKKVKNKTGKNVKQYPPVIRHPSTDEAARKK